MITSNKGNTEISGSMLEILADVSAIVSSAIKAIEEEVNRKAAKALVKCACKYGFLPEQKRRERLLEPAMSIFAEQNSDDKEEANA